METVECNAPVSSASCERTFAPHEFFASTEESVIIISDYGDDLMSESTENDSDDFPVDTWEEEKNTIEIDECEALRNEVKRLSNENKQLTDELRRLSEECLVKQENLGVELATSSEQVGYDSDGNEKKQDCKRPGL
ncbi:hypothetical protein ACHQM5_023200 [Ranunculus cassubicifolius]